MHAAWNSYTAVHIISVSVPVCVHLYHESIHSSINNISSGRGRVGGVSQKLMLTNRQNKNGPLVGKGSPSFFFLRYKSYFLWCSTPCKISWPLDNPFLEDSNRTGEWERNNEIIVATTFPRAMYALCSDQNPSTLQNLHHDLFLNDLLKACIGCLSY